MAYVFEDGNGNGQNKFWGKIVNKQLKMIEKRSDEYVRPHPQCKK
jgi:hypothetical protein